MKGGPTSIGILLGFVGGIAFGRDCSPPVPDPLPASLAGPVAVCTTEDGVPGIILTFCESQEDCFPSLPVCRVAR